MALMAQTESHDQVQNARQEPEHKPSPPAASEDIPHFEFSSNPFKSSILGLSKALSVNPIASITIPLLPIPILFAAVVVSVFLGKVLPPIAAVLITLVIAVTMIVLLIRILTATIVLYQRSFNHQHITGREALGSASSSRLTAYVLTSILALIALVATTILLIVPGVIIGARISLYGFVVFEENLSGLAALKRSWRLTKGHTFEMIGAIFAQNIIIRDGLLALVGVSSGLANRYYELRYAEHHNLDKGKTHWLNYVLPVAIVLSLALYVASYLFIVINSANLNLNDSADFESRFDDSTLFENNDDFNFRFEQ